MQWHVHLELLEWSIERTKNGEPQTVLLTPEANISSERRKKAANRRQQVTFRIPGSGGAAICGATRGLGALARGTALVWWRLWRKGNGQDLRLPTGP